MASTNKTANIVLNQWLGSDSIKREDLNADNLKIDNKFGSVDASLSEKANTISPTFTGTVKTSKNTLDDASGNAIIAGQAQVGSAAPFILTNNGCPASPNRSYGAIGQWNEGVGVQGTKNAGVTSNYIFSVLTNDQTQYLSVFNGGKIITKNNTLDDGVGSAVIKGVLSVNGSMEHGSTVAASTPYIDFHSSGTNIDYDSRIVASGGNGSVGGGGINIQANVFQMNGNTICHLGNEPSFQSSSGYKKFADGTIIQWGNASSIVGANTVTFPITFTSACYNVQVTPNNSNNPASVGVYNQYVNQFSMKGTVAQGVYWIAIGV